VGAKLIGITELAMLRWLRVIELLPKARAPRQSATTND